MKRFSDIPRYLKLLRQRQEFSAWTSSDGRRWVQRDWVDADLNERVEVGVFAVNSSTRVLSAELERFIVSELRGLHGSGLLIVASLSQFARAGVVCFTRHHAVRAAKFGKNPGPQCDNSQGSQAAEHGRGYGANERRGDARFEFAQFIGRAYKHPIHSC